MKKLSTSLLLMLGTSGVFGAHEGTLVGSEHELVGRDGREVSADALTQKPYLFIYFSAGWCPLCKKFTPQLIEFYEKYYRKGDFEILFVSSDKTPEGMRKYWATGGIPGIALKLESKRSAELTHEYGASEGGIPCVVLLGPDGTLVSSSFKDGKYLGPDAALKRYLELR